MHSVLENVTWLFIVFSCVNDVVGLFKNKKTFFISVFKACLVVKMIFSKLISLIYF